MNSATRADRSVAGISSLFRVTRQSAGSPSPAGGSRMRQPVGSMLRTTCTSADCAGTASAEVRGMSTSYPCSMRGTTTMKMISRTSTTSTSGVMLISDCRLEPEPELLSCMIAVSLPVSFGSLGDQTHPAEAGILDREHGHPDLAEVEPCVAPDHDLGVRHGARRGAELFAELIGGDRPIVDPHPSGVVDG